MHPDMLTVQLHHSELPTALRDSCKTRLFCSCLQCQAELQHKGTPILPVNNRPKLSDVNAVPVKTSGNKHAICTQFLMAIVFVMVIGDLLHNQSSTIHISLLIIHNVTPSDNRLYVA